MGTQMMILVVVSAAVGLLLAFVRSRVPSVALASAFFAAVVAMYGVLLGYHLGPSILIGFGSVAAGQLSYLAIWLSLDLFPSKNLIPQVQAAVGQQLGRELVVPRDLPPEMASLVMRLKAA